MRQKIAIIFIFLFYYCFENFEFSTIYRMQQIELVIIFLLDFDLVRQGEVSSLGSRNEIKLVSIIRFFFMKCDVKK